MLNKAMLIGNLGADPELRYTQSGVAAAGFRIATSRRWKDKDGQQQEQTEWHNIVAWDRLGEICNEYLGKGSKVYVEGWLQTRKWADSNGNDRYSTEIVASNVQFLTPKNESGGQSAGSNHGDRSAGQGGSGYNQGDTSYGPSGDTGSDVPF